MTRPAPHIEDASDARAPLLVLLRDRTRVQHAQLDEALALTDDLTLARYEAFLAASLSAVAIFEPAIERWLGAGVGPSRRAALAEDLRAIAERRGARASTRPPAATKTADAQPPSSRAEAFGCAYVLEGSTLGGVVLARAVASALALPPDVGTAYLRLRGERTGAQWRSFLEALAAFDSGATNRERDDACAFAASTFEAYAVAFGLRAGA